MSDQFKLSRRTANNVALSVSRLGQKLVRVFVRDRITVQCIVETLLERGAKVNALTAFEQVKKEFDVDDPLGIRWRFNVLVRWGFREMDAYKLALSLAGVLL